MARTDDDVIDELSKLYSEEFGGKEKCRFLIEWADLRSLYGFTKLFYSRFEQLAEKAAVERGLYLWELSVGETGHFVAVVKTSTIDRWRKVPRKVIKNHLPSQPGPHQVAEPDDDEE